MSRHWSAKADANQPEIVKALRAMGAAVEHLHRLKNLCDLLVTYKGVTIAVEIKAKPTDKLSKGEEEFRGRHIAHGGKWARLETIEDCRALIQTIEDAV